MTIFYTYPLLLNCQCQTVPKPHSNKDTCLGTRVHLLIYVLKQSANQVAAVHRICSATNPGYTGQESTIARDEVEPVVVFSLPTILESRTASKGKVWLVAFP